jgi:ribosomal protein S18 acetylase RimI-like enzyme
LGYVSPVVLADGAGGEIDFLGVREDSRRRGIGRKLLQRALYWLFEEKNVTPITLTVLGKNMEARSLYESVGFRLKYTGVGLRKTDFRMLGVDRPA